MREGAGWRDCSLPHLLCTGCLRAAPHNFFDLWLVVLWLLGFIIKDQYVLDLIIIQNSRLEGSAVLGELGKLSGGCFVLFDLLIYFIS